MDSTQAAYIAAICNEAVTNMPTALKNESEPVQRSYVDSYIMDQIRKYWDQADIDALGSMDIQNTMDYHPKVPKTATLRDTGTPGVKVLSNQNIVTAPELARQMEENNAKLLLAMERMITAQKQQPAPTTTDPTKGGN
jgi:hypothetical protein